MTPARNDLLQRCALAGAAGYRPKGREWPPAYWLAARGMLQAVQIPATTPKFVITAFGLAALAQAHNNRETA